MKKIIFSILLLAAFTGLHAQQIPNWSSFYENGFLWNPALTAKWNRWEFTATHRQEWTGFDGAPQTSTLTFQLPFISTITKSSIGFMVESDEIGPFSKESIGMSYNYRFRPELFGNGDDVFSLGVLGRADFNRFNPQALVFFDAGGDTPQTPTSFDNTIRPNLDIGLFYTSVSDFYSFKSHYYFGISANRLMSGRVLRIGSGTVQSSIHGSFHAGYRHFPFRSDYFIETSLLVSNAETEALNAMLSVRFEKEYKYWFSGGVVSNGEFFAQAGLIMDEDSFLSALAGDGYYRLGVKMDYSVRALGRYSGVGYEFYLAYLFELE